MRKGKLANKAAKIALPVLWEHRESIIEGAKQRWDLLAKGGKDRLGEFTMYDAHAEPWFVKVRKTGKRGRYVKFESLSKTSSKRIWRVGCDHHDNSAQSLDAAIDEEVFLRLFAIADSFATKEDKTLRHHEREHDMTFVQDALEQLAALQDSD